MLSRIKYSGTTIYSHSTDNSNFSQSMRQIRCRRARVCTAKRRGTRRVSARPNRASAGCGSKRNDSAFPRKPRRTYKYVSNFTRWVCSPTIICLLSSDALPRLTPLRPRWFQNNFNAPYQRLKAKLHSFFAAPLGDLKSHPGRPCRALAKEPTQHSPGQPKPAFRLPSWSMCSFNCDPS